MAIAHKPDVAPKRNYNARRLSDVCGFGKHNRTYEVAGGEEQGLCEFDINGQFGES